MSDAKRDERIEILKQMLNEEGGESSVAQMAEDLGAYRGAATDDGGVARAYASLEAVFLIAAADGQLLRSEIDEINVLIGRLLQRPLAPKHIDHLLDVFTQDLDRDDYAGRVKAIARALPDEWARRAAFVMAVGVAWIDGSFQDEERDVVELMGREFELKPDVVKRILSRVEERMREKK